MAARKKSATRKQSPSRKKSASRTPSRAPDAIALLKADHTLVSGLFAQYEKTRSADRKAALAQQICNELTVHAQIEEEIFYPAARGAIRDMDLLDEATVEHQGAKDLIAQIEASKPGADLFDAKVTVLSEYIKHHVKEEHTELFPKVKKTKLDLRALGEQLQARKMELKESGGGKGKKSPANGARKRAGGSAANSEKNSPAPAEAADESFVARMARGIGLVT